MPIPRLSWVIGAIVAGMLAAGPARADPPDMPLDKAHADPLDVPLDQAGRPDWADHAIAQAGKVKEPKKDTTEAAPPKIPQLFQSPDPDGTLATYQPGGDTKTKDQAFFTPLGGNGRTCQSCHQPTAAWSITPSQVQKLFDESQGTAPVFRLVDGAVCPTADVSTAAARRSAYNLLVTKGLIRSFINVPAPPLLQYSIVAVQDPYGCTTDPAYGLTSYGAQVPTVGTVSVYRRPLPPTNLRFSTGLMWDGREPNLTSQAADAARIHFGAPTDPTPEQLAQIVAFETGLYTAQYESEDVGSLTWSDATGGPVFLSKVPFYLGINDMLGGDPNGIPFNKNAMTLYASWTSPPDEKDAVAEVARGEQLFNDKPITLSGVPGLNDTAGQPIMIGTCTTCHDTPNVGDHSVRLAKNIGTTAPSAPGLDTSGLPVFTLRCDSGPFAGQTYQVTDPGKALITGRCVDIGKTKGPVLRGLAGRAPYFHNGSAPDLGHVVDFYDKRFGIGFKPDERAALVAFLNKL